MSQTNDVKIKALSPFIAENATPSLQASLRVTCSKKKNGTLKDETQAIIDTCRELEVYLTEPHEWLAYVAWAEIDSVALSIVLEMNIHRHIQEGDDPTSLAQLADMTGGSIELIKRATKQCVKQSIFEEIEPEMHRHNNRSKCLLHHEFFSLIHYLVDDWLLCGAHLARNTLQNNMQIPDDPHRSAFQHAFQADKTLYNYCHSVDPKQERRFADAMAGHYNTPLGEPIQDIFPFNSFDPNSSIVDIGSRSGQNPMRLATKFPGMPFIVQDHGSVVEAAQSAVPSTIAGRMQWQSQDMYFPQQVEGADTYLLSHVLMDNSDSNCATVIKHITDVMKPGVSKNLVHNFVDPGKDGYASPFLNSLDLHTSSSLNTVS